MTETTTLAPWQHVWRNGVVPLLSRGQLEALRKGLAEDDEALVQDSTVVPPPLACVRNSSEYRLVPGFPKYMAGTDGSLWTKYVRGSKGKSDDHWRVVRGQKEAVGYIRDSLHRSGERRRVRRHQIILETFVSPRPQGMEACHENDVKSDNRLVNLSWGTRTKNSRDAVRNGRVVIGGSRPNAKLDMAKAALIRSDRSDGYSLRQLANRYKVSVGTVRQVLSHRTYAMPQPVDGPLVEAACAIGYCGWKAGLQTVGEVNEFFAQMCFGIDQRLGEPGGCRHFLRWFDETPREEVLPALLAEIDLALLAK